ncbi:Cytochrome C oxidase, cbb3-type, subunit III [Modicisalibacter muralis]|uniref:Cytochrome C oxidase, cbb3-type, subunit III n=1 Tax=Modicisalibacter muralis TaxID=119000 RepID=A0A1G9KEC0_9GAMM|nr:cytochrome c [Halomonas muralis]SDL48210.1 Cytochrome C oxidase, cbb3-type, subunit III [Halomonas muralis]
MKLVYGVILALIALAAGGVAFVYSGVYDVAASDEHTPLGEWVIHTTMHNSIESQASDVTVPDLDGRDMVAQGARAYDALCAACHLKPGLEETALRAGLNPMPPALTQPIHWGPAAQFWIVKHGIKMTGMPAWGATHEDGELWEIVAFLQQLPELSEQEYAALVNPGDSPSGERAGEGHARNDGHDHTHGDMSGMMGDSSKQAAASHSDMDGMDSSISGAAQETGKKGSSDHYADGHTH